MNKSSLELSPLQGGYQRYLSNSRKGKQFNGPLKAIRLCCLGILLPGLLIFVPIYMRYKVYDHQLYPVGVTDMRLIDGKVSTTWCQKQVVRSNATFNAFLMPQLPQITNEHIPVSMTRHLLLNDDMKEYWGFYLLKGSTVTVSTCVRWPGGSLILIRGHKNLHDCAYIGDDSSEELEELMALAAEKGIDTKSHTVENPSNDPNLLRKLSSDIKMHDPKAQEAASKYKFSEQNKKSDESEISAREMKEILNLLYVKAGYQKTPKKFNENFDKKLLTNLHKHHETTDNIHKHRDTNLNPKEEQNIKFNLTRTTTTVTTVATIEIDTTKPIETVQEKINLTSTEMFDDLYERIKRLGPKGHNMLENLKKQLENEKPKENILIKNDDVKKNKEGSVLETIEEKLFRFKRDIIIKTAIQDLNEDDEKGNLAIEEGFIPDEHADHHEIINETTLNDRSNSEFWSSFSSSEEALLNCAGLILSLPLTPHRQCSLNVPEKEFKTASFANTITYSVPTNGYYFFVFNSENEVQQNYIRVTFDLLKTVYNVSHPIDKCSNTTEQCSLPLNFFSNEKVIFEVPFNNNDSLWNEEFVVLSECEPRTAIYLICVLLVPMLILMFAFQ